MPRNKFPRNMAGRAQWTFSLKRSLIMSLSAESLLPFILVVFLIVSEWTPKDVQGCGFLLFYPLKKERSIFVFTGAETKHLIMHLHNKHRPHGVND